MVIKEADGEGRLPVWIGLLGVQAIADLLEGISFSRPTIHDLIRGIMDAIDVKVNRVVVSDAKNSSCNAFINIVLNCPNAEGPGLF